MAVAARNKSSLPGSPIRAARTSNNGLRRLPPDVNASREGRTSGAGARSPTAASKPSTSSTVSNAPSGRAERSLPGSVGASRSAVERDDAAPEPVPCNIL